MKHVLKIVRGSHTRAALAFNTVLAISMATGWGDIRLPEIISDHMVLQRTDKTSLWGKADPGEEISVKLGDRTAGTKAGDDGKWRVYLDLRDSPPGPFTLCIAGKNRIVISDVVVGEVWLAAGQSNMDWRLKDTIEAPAEIPKATNPWLRQFREAAAAIPSPGEDCKGRWEPCSPGTAPDFSAVAYHFQKALAAELHVPVGVISVPLGGTSCEAWTSKEALNTDPGFKEAAERWEKALIAFPDLQAAFTADFGAWLQKTGRNDNSQVDPAKFAAENLNTADWIHVHLPGTLSSPGLPANGTIWLRRDVNLPHLATTQALRLQLGTIDGFVTIYWNGQQVKQTTWRDFPGTGYSYICDLPPTLCKEGLNTLAVRIFAPVKPTRFSAGAGDFAAIYNSTPFPLSGDWLAKAEFSLPALTEAALASAPRPPAPRPKPQDVPGYLFNGMINPVIPYTIRGVIWYQGENNASRAWQYGKLFPLMILDWRRHWQRNDLPFYFCQLPCYLVKSPVPQESSWAELREAQSLALKLPDTGEAVLIDTGEAEFIHPRHKEAAGQRLSLIALAHDYGRKIAFSGPVYESAQVEAATVRVRFSHADGGLVARPLPETYDVKTLLHETAPLIRNSPASQLEGFSICGEDRKWFWANARIDGDTVAVTSEKVPNPVAVRYAWASNPTCNLYNGAGLPASPFRTDTFPVSTANNGY